MLSHIVSAHTRKHHDERNEELEEAGEDKTLLSLIHTLGCKTLLDDVLVEAPVTEVCKPYSTHNSHNTRHICKSARIVRLLDDKMEVGVPGIFTSCKCRIYIPETFHSSTVSGSLEGEPGCDKTAAYKEKDLHNVSPGHRCKTAINRIYTSHNEEHHDNHHPHRNHRLSQSDVHSLKAEDLLDGKGAKPGNGSKVYEYIKEEPQYRKGKAYAVIVPFPEELRNSEYLLLEHHRKEELAYYDKGHGSHNLICRSCDTVTESCSGHSDELFC